MDKIKCEAKLKKRRLCVWKRLDIFTEEFILFCNNEVIRRGYAEGRAMISELNGWCGWNWDEE